MLRVFQSDLFEPGHFVVTLELVPGREATGRAVDAVTGIAREAFEDGRISAVSITDNPGGNPSLSPDVLGHDIFNIGTGQGTTINQVYQALQTATGSQGDAHYGPDKAGEVSRTYLDIGKAERELGWKPEVGLQEGMRRTIASFRDAA